MKIETRGFNRITSFEQGIQDFCISDFTNPITINIMCFYNKDGQAMPCIHCAIFLEILSRLGVDVEIPLTCAASPEPPEIDMLITRKEVMHKLNIKDSTYTRWIERGILVPRILGRRHFYTNEDLVRAFKESVRKGKR